LQKRHYGTKKQRASRQNLSRATRKKNGTGKGKRGVLAGGCKSICGVGLGWCGGRKPAVNVFVCGTSGRTRNADKKGEKKKNGVSGPVVGFKTPTSKEKGGRRDLVEPRGHGGRRADAASLSNV